MRVPRVARDAIADGAVAVGFTHAMALLAAAGHRRSAFQLHKGMRRPARSARLIGLGKINLLRRESLLAINRGPGRRGMAAVQKLLIDGFVATAAISRRKLRGDHKAVVILLFLPFGRLMAIQAVHAFGGVLAQLVFVNHGILRPHVAFGAFSGGAHEFRAGLIGFRFGPGTVQQKRGHDQGKGDDDGEEYGAKRHRLLPSDWHPTSSSASQKRILT